MLRYHEIGSLTQLAYRLRVGMAITMRVQSASAVFALLITCVQPVVAQTPAAPVSVGTGFALPMDLNIGRMDEITGGNMAPAFWGELSIAPTSRVSLHTSVELPGAYDTRWRHPGTAGFDAVITHRDLVLTQSVGYMPYMAGKTQVVALVGFGLVFTRDVWRTTCPQLSTSCSGPFSGTEPREEVRIETDVAPSLVGGLNVSFALNQQMSIVGRIRARGTSRSDSVLFGSVNVTPGIGIQFSF